MEHRKTRITFGRGFIPGLSFIPGLPAGASMMRAAAGKMPATLLQFDESRLNHV